MKFTLLPLVVVVALLAVLYEVDSAVPKGRRNKQVPPGGHNESCTYNSSYNRHNDYRRFGTRYEWNYIVDGVFAVPVCAFVKNGSDFAMIKSGDESSRKNDVTPAFITYHYIETTFLGLFIPLNGSLPCLLHNTTLTFDEVKETIADYNGTDADDLFEEKLDGTNELTQQKRKELMDSSRIARKECHDRRIFCTAKTANDSAMASNTKKIYVVGLQALYTITVISNSCKIEP